MVNTAEIVVPADFRSGFAAIVGPANAGKSTLVNALVGKKVSIVSPKEQTTRNRVTGIKTRADGQIILVDTPGFLTRKYRGELAKYIGDTLQEAATGADVVVLVCDAEKLVREQNLAERLQDSLGKKRIQSPAIVVINKIDLVERKQLLPGIEALDKVFGKVEGGKVVDLIPVSARTGDGVQQLADLLIKKLPVGPALFPADEVSTDSDEFLAAEIIREKFFLRLHKELPYSVAVKVESWNDEPGISKVKACVMVERDSQKRIVIGAGGENLKAVGTAARIELERIFGTKFFLELFVRVEENWTRNAKGMARAGIK